MGRVSSTSNTRARAIRAFDLAMLVAPMNDVDRFSILEGYSAAVKDLDVVRRALELCPLARIARVVAVRQRMRAVEDGRAFVVTESRARRARSPRVVVDGTAGSGKSSLSRALAQRLKVPHINSGALYRYLAHLDIDDNTRLLRAAERADLTPSLDGGVIAGGARVHASLFLPAVDARVAHVARSPRVRAFVNARTRAVLKGGGYVLEGRDAKAVIAPRADIAFFVDADLEVRARRLKIRAGLNLAAARRAVRARDALDAADTHFVNGAHRIDTSTWRPRGNRRVRRAPLGARAMRFPTVPHIAESELGTGDISLSPEVEARVRSRAVTIVEKLDGVNAVIRKTRAGNLEVELKERWARAMGGRLQRAIELWVAQRRADLGKLTRREEVAVEWCWHRLSAAYDRLPDLALGIAVTESERFLSAARAAKRIRSLGLVPNDVVYRGRLDRTDFAALTARSQFGPGAMEGLVLQTGLVDVPFAKWVRAGFEQCGPRTLDPAKTNGVVRG